MRLRVTLFFMLLSSFLTAQKTTYSSALINAVTIFNASDDHTDYTNLIQDLEKLQSSSPKDWIPPYYLALAHAKMSMNKGVNAEMHADKALYWAQQSILNNPNDETYCLNAMALISKMAINPFIRYVKFIASIDDNLKKAKKMNPNNPRPYILEANLQMNLPKLLGGGCKQARPLISKAQQLLNNQTPSLVLPTWGKQSVIELKRECPF